MERKGQLAGPAVYEPVLKHYCNSGNVPQALQVRACVLILDTCIMFVPTHPLTSTQLLEHLEREQMLTEPMYRVFVKAYAQARDHAQVERYEN